MDQIDENEDGEKLFQGVKLANFSNALDSVEKLKNGLTSLVEEAIEKRLEDDSNELIENAATILNTAA